MQNNLEGYLNLKGWEFKFKNGQYCLDQCPLSGCGPGHFYIGQANEMFYCQKCGEKGHVLSLKKRLGDIPLISHVSNYSKTPTPSKTIDLALIEKYHKDLWENPVALAYLTDQRGFTLETIKKFKLGFNDGAITVPHFRDGLCLNIKSRPIKPKDNKFFRKEGYPSILFNLDNAKKYRDSVIITEGEFDTIAFDQMGFSNVIAVTGGAETFLNEWIDDLEQFNQIYLSYDMDESGRIGMEKAADKLGRYRCLNLLLPLKDGNDCLKAGFTNGEIAQILAQAKPFDSRLVKRPEAFFEDIQNIFKNPSLNNGTQTGWQRFDELFGGFRPSELTILTGETASGKTTWAVNLGYKFFKKGHPVLIASFEMKPVAILKKMIQMESGQPMAYHSIDSLSPFFSSIASMPLYFVDVYGEIGLKELKDSIYYAQRRYDVRLVILDHLHFFLRYSGDQERQAIDQALRDVKTWAMELNIHIVLIVHPTKLTYDNKEVRLNDLKGSSGLKQIPDNVLSIWRPRGEDNLKNPQSEVRLDILKVRDDAGDEGVVVLTFDKRSQSYRESN